MNLQTIKNAATSKVGRQILITKKHSPTLLFAGGVVGIVGTTVLACKATLKLEEVLEEAEKSHAQANELVHEDYSERDRKKDHVYIYVRTVVKVTKLYAPAVGLGIVSIGALTGSHVTLTKRNAGLTAAYAALDKGFNEYRDRVREEFGEEKEREIRQDIRIRDVDIHDTETGKDHQYQIKAPGEPSIYARFFDECSSSWSRQPEYNMIFLKAQQNYANDRLRTRGHIFLNEVYDMLGLERSQAGAVVGWVISKDGDNYVDFGIWDGDRERSRAFVNGYEASVLLDFNVDGVIYDKI
jgi:hypothetical protein